MLRCILAVLSSDMHCDTCTSVKVELIMYESQMSFMRREIVNLYYDYIVSLVRLQYSSTSRIKMCFRSSMLEC